MQNGRGVVTHPLQGHGIAGKADLYLERLSYRRPSPRRPRLVADILRRRSIRPHHCLEFPGDKQRVVRNVGTRQNERDGRRGEEAALVVADTPAHIRIVDEILHNTYKVKIATNSAQARELATGSARRTCS